MGRDEILRVLQALDDAGVDYVLIGGMALGFHGIVRATEDMDLLVRASRENIRRLQIALRDAYAGDPNVEEIRADDLLGDYPAVRYYPPSGDLYFDLMTKLDKMETFETVEAETKEVDGVPVTLATPAALHRLEKGAVRAVGWQDAAMLRDRFSLAEDDQVRVQRFRSIEEMNAAPVHDRANDGFERFIRHNARLRLLPSRANLKGVFKFRSLEEAQAARHAQVSPHRRR